MFRSHVTHQPNHWFASISFNAWEAYEYHFKFTIFLQRIFDNGFVSNCECCTLPQLRWCPVGKCRNGSTQMISYGPHVATSRHRLSCHHLFSCSCSTKGMWNSFLAARGMTCCSLPASSVPFMNAQKRLGGTAEQWCMVGVSERGGKSLWDRLIACFASCKANNLRS